MKSFDVSKIHDVVFKEIREETNKKIAETISIEEIKRKKQQCESEIKSLLITFEDQSGLLICGLNLLLQEQLGTLSQIENVTIDVKL